MLSKSPLHHRRSERGNVLIITAASLLLILGLAALAIDLGSLLNGKAELQNALDAAALASVSQTRVVIANNTTKKNLGEIPLLYKYAKDFAKLNEVRFKSQGGTSQIVLQDENIDISQRGDADPMPSIAASYQTPLPTFFAHLLGFSEVSVNARAEATLVPVNGGTGLISGGAIMPQGSSGPVVSGGWRPILIPDSYFVLDDTGNILREERLRIVNNQIQAPPDRAVYRSRFAAKGAGYPYVDAWQAANPLVPGINSYTEVTSLRDAFFPNDTSLNIIGLQITIFSNADLQLADHRMIIFTDPTETADLAFYGFSDKVTVGQTVNTLPPGDNAGVYFRLRDLRNTVTSSMPYNGDLDAGKPLSYGYVTTCTGCRFETPNTYPLIVPVLLCNPFDFYRKAINPAQGNAFTVTNIGAFFIEAAGGDLSSGFITGRFVREMIVGGTAVNPASYNYPWLLPASARLVRK